MRSYIRMRVCIICDRDAYLKQQLAKLKENEAQTDEAIKQSKTVRRCIVIPATLILGIITTILR